MKRRRSSGINTDAKSPKRDNISAIIIDNGAYNIKVGLSKSEAPILVPNCIMKAKSERKRLFVGNQINECRDCSGLYYLLPCERGYITKWDVQKPVWDYIFSKNVVPLDDKPVLMTQPLFNFKSIQDCIDEIFFEEYEVSSMFRLNPTDLAKIKYADAKKLSENTSCIVVDTGFSFTHVVPYINNNKYLRGIRRLNVGGKLLTNHLKDLISYRQYNVMEETYVINQVKEDTCYVTENVIDELKLAAKKDNSIVKNYVLPDFNNIRRGYIQDPKDQKEIEENCQILRLNNERFVVPEILFHPSDIGMKSMGIAEAVVDSIYNCPVEHRENLAKHVIVVGGNAKFPGFKTRFYSELRSHLPVEWELNVFVPNEPITYTWEGGATFIKDPDFKTLLVTKSEYEELGSTIVQQRFNTWMSDSSEPEVRKEKQRETFNYLDKIKGKSIFGKHEPNTESENEDSVINVDTDKKDEQDAVDNQDVIIQDDKQKKNNIKEQKLNESSDYYEDLINSVELFPFGTDSYL